MPSRRSVSRSALRQYLNTEASKWASSLGGLPAGPKALARALARRSDKFGCCWPKQETLAAELGCSVRSVRSYARTLEQWGLVRCIGRCRELKRNSNVYHLLGWPSRKPLPVRGHPAQGQYVKEPAPQLLLDALRRQHLLQQAAKSAEHNKEPELLTISAEEEILERCLDALHDWISERSHELLIDDYLSLIDYVTQGYSLERHILPVLQRKAQTCRPARVIRSWHYFADAIAEYAREQGKPVDNAPERSSCLQQPSSDDPAQESEQMDVQQLIAELVQNREQDNDCPEVRQ